MQVIKNSIGILFLCFSSLLSAQTLRGTVKESVTGNIIAGAIMTLESDQKGEKKTVNSDEQGIFRFDNLQPGYYQLSVEQVGCQKLTLKELLVTSGKERVLNLLLDLGTTTIPVVEVVEARYDHKMQPLGEIPLSRDQTLRYPMTYYDPARLATAFAGVAQTDDGTNSISVRGNNPGLLRWRLEGVDIVSPNHLSNAGTLSDRPAISSGGVLMLSAQMLDNTSLLTSNYSAQYGDAIGGIMDMHLRKGNNQQAEQTIQVGLVGLDATLEGPFSKRKRGSYLINYRYSTVGLLGVLGVKFGGEKINFQDFAMNLNLPTKNCGDFTIFGLLGHSINQFTGKSFPDTATTFKERFNIDYSSWGGAFGITHFVRLGKQVWWKTSSATSFQNNTREQNNDQRYYAYDDGMATRISNSTMLNYSVTEAFQIRSGLTLNLLVNDRYTMLTDSQNQIFNSFSAIEGNVQLWTQVEGQFAQSAGMYQMGLHASLSSFSVVDPRFLAAYRISPQHKIAAGLGLYSQLTPFLTGRFASTPMLRSSHYTLRHTWSPKNGAWVLRTELFHQGIAKALINGNAPDGYSVLNEIDVTGVSFPAANGVGVNYGIESTIERYLNKGWFLNGNVTLLRSKAEGSDGVTRGTRWDVGQIVNLTAGKEWNRKMKKNKPNRLFGANGHAVFMGGYRAYPIDVSGSEAQSATIFYYGDGPSERLPAYFRIDGRVYWKRNLANKRNSTLAVEFQNLAFRKNVAFRYYEPFTKTIETKYQLGLIPNLSWRVEL